MGDKRNVPMEAINLINQTWDDQTLIRKYEETPVHQTKECWKVIYIEIKNTRLRAFPMTKEQYDNFRSLQSSVLGITGVKI